MEILHHPHPPCFPVIYSTHGYHLSLLFDSHVWEYRWEEVVVTVPSFYFVALN